MDAQNEVCSRVACPPDLLAHADKLVIKQAEAPAYNVA